MCYVPYITRACCGAFYDPGDMDLPVMELCATARCGPVFRTPSRPVSLPPDPNWTKCKTREYKRFLFETRYPLPCQKCSRFPPSPKRLVKSAKYTRRLFRSFTTGLQTFNIPVGDLWPVQTAALGYHAILPRMGIYLRLSQSPVRSKAMRREDKKKAHQAFEKYMRALGAFIRQGIVWSNGALVYPSKPVPGAPKVRKCGQDGQGSESTGKKSGKKSGRKGKKDRKRSKKTGKNGGELDKEIGKG